MMPLELVFHPNAIISVVCRCGKSFHSTSPDGSAKYVEWATGHDCTYRLPKPDQSMQPKGEK